MLPHLDPLNPKPCSYGIAERTFTFGSVVARLQEAGTAAVVGGGTSAEGGKDGAAGSTKGAAAGAKGPAAGPGKAPAAAAAGSKGAKAGEAAGAAAGGASGVTGGSTGGGGEAPAVKANLKFINPFKVACTLRCSVKPRTGSQPAGKWWMKPGLQASSQHNSQGDPLA